MWNTLIEEDTANGRFVGDEKLSRQEHIFRCKIKLPDLEQRMSNQACTQIIQQALTRSETCMFLTRILVLMKNNIITCMDDRYEIESVSKCEQYAIQLSVIRLTDVPFTINAIIPIKEVSILDSTKEHQRHGYFVEIRIDGVDRFHKIAVVFAIKAIATIVLKASFFSSCNDKESVNEKDQVAYTKNQDLLIETVFSNREKERFIYLQNRRSIVIDEINQLVKKWENKLVIGNSFVSVVRKKPRNIEYNIRRFTDEFHHCKLFLVRNGVTPSSVEEIYKWFVSEQCVPINDSQFIQPKFVNEELFGIELLGKFLFLKFLVNYNIILLYTKWKCRCTMLRIFI